MFGSIGMPELILIFVVALLVFGPKKLPEIGKSLGKGLAEFKKASDELKKTIEREIEDGKNEVASVASDFHSAGNSIAQSRPVAVPDPPSEAAKTEPAPTPIHPS